MRASRRSRKLVATRQAKAAARSRDAFALSHAKGAVARRSDQFVIVSFGFVTGTGTPRAGRTARQRQLCPSPRPS